MVFYKISFCCKAIIGLTTRHLRNRIKEDVAKSIETFLFSEMKEDISVKVLNASKRSSIAEYLANNTTCANSFYLNRFKKRKRNVLD